MQTHFRKLHLALASSVALALIITAYVFSGPFSFRPTTVDAATAETLLKAYATKDSDSDGLPDWQESLYGTDPANPESVQKGVRDGDAVAQGLVKPKFTSAENTNSDIPTDGPGSVANDTLTAQFARQFFTAYFNTYGAQVNLNEADLASFTQKAVESLVANNKKASAFKPSSVTVAGKGRDALVTYAVLEEAVFTKYAIATEKDEMTYLDDAMQRNDPAALKKVQEIGIYYSKIGSAYVKVGVPGEAAGAHLAVANAFANMGVVVTHMGTVRTDPVRALLGLMLYQDAADQLQIALRDLYSALQSDGVVLIEGQPGYSVYRLAKFAADSTTP